MLQAGRQAVRQAWGFVRPGSDRCFVAAPLAIPADRSRASRWPVKSKTLRGSMFQFFPPVANRTSMMYIGAVRESAFAHGSSLDPSFTDHNQVLFY